MDELDPALFLTAPVLAWQAALKKTKVQLDLLTDIDMLLMVKKVLDAEYFFLSNDVRKLITNT